MTAPLTMSDIPGPRLNPILGWRGFVVAFARDSIGFLHKLNDTYGEIAQVGRGKMSATFTFHPDYTRQILSNPSLFHSYDLESVPFPFSDIESLRSLTTAIAMMNGEQHKRQRRLMAPSLHASHLHHYVNGIVEITERFFRKWKPGQVTDLYADMDLFAAFLAMKVFVGMDPDGDNGRYYANLFEEVLRLIFSPLVFLFPHNFPGFPYRRLIRRGIELEQGLKRLIEARRERPLDGSDILSVFLQTHDEDGNRMTDDEVIGQTVAIFRGGSKTSASALTWTMFLLALHPRIQTALLDELRSQLRGCPPTFEQLNQLPLLENVIKESLRLLPPVAWGIRVSMDEFDLGPYRLERGNNVIYSAHVTHRRPDIYKNPSRFDPVRWLEIKPSPYEYFPFSAGPRRCLGAEFAMVELKIVLAILLQRFRLTVLPGQRIDRAGLTGSSPKYGIKVRIDRQDGDFRTFPIKGNIHRFAELAG